MSSPLLSESASACAREGAAAVGAAAGAATAIDGAAAAEEGSRAAAREGAATPEKGAEGAASAAGAAVPLLPCGLAAVCVLRGPWHPRRWRGGDEGESSSVLQCASSSQGLSKLEPASCTCNLSFIDDVGLMR